MAASTSMSLSKPPTFISTTTLNKPSISPSSFKLPATATVTTFKSFTSNFPPSRATAISRQIPHSASTDFSPATSFHGLCYVLGDNIDTDQIIPAEHLTLVPSNPAEYQKLGSFALCGLPSSYTTRFIETNQMKSNYTIIIAGNNFGCGSSREHAPVALGAAGVATVVAESYARIFFRNSVATGEIYPLEPEVRVCEECKTGDMITIELSENKLINHTTGKQYNLKPIGDAGPVIEAGGIFDYARETGMIPSQ